MARKQIHLICLFAILVLTRTLISDANAQKSSSRKTYPYDLAPGQVISMLQDLPAVGVTVSADENALFEDAEDGKLDEHSFAEALLIASGVASAEQRQKYLDQLAEIEQKAREATKQSEKAIEKGELLLKFMHSGPMAKGYRSKQTDIHSILDTGNFNCVSSAALYNVLASRLGMKVRFVEIPEHVFSIIDLGDRWADVETTNAMGFNPSRDPDTQKKITKPGGTCYIPERHKDLRREIDQLGMVAVTFYNHGVQLSDDKRQGAAIVASLSALCLDRDNASAVKNALAGLTNWPLDLCDNGKFEEALQIQAVGLKMAPSEAGLLNNRKVVWQKYAQSMMEAGDAQKAVAVLKRAAAENPGGDFIIRQADLFIRQAEPHIAGGNLTDALAVCNLGLAIVDPGAQDRLRKWQSIQVHNHVLRTINEKIKETDYESALSVIASHSEQLDDERHVRSFLLQVYDSWANQEMQTKNWQAAVQVYTSALEQLPADSHLTQNAVYVYDSWAHQLMQTEKWSEAIGVYERALSRFPGNGHLSNNLAYCQSQLEK